MKRRAPRCHEHGACARERSPRPETRFWRARTRLLARRGRVLRCYENTLRTCSRETADTLAALPRFWVHSLGRQRTTGERITSRPNTQPGLPSNHHLWKLPRSGPSPRRSAARCARIFIFVQGGGRAAGHEVSFVDRRITMTGAVISTTDRRHTTGSSAAGPSGTSGPEGPEGREGPEGPEAHDLKLRALRAARARRLAISLEGIARVARTP